MTDHPSFPVPDHPVQDHPGDGLLQAVLDGELEEDRRGGVQEHLRRCRRCRDRMGELEALATRISRELSTLEPRSDLDAALWEIRRARARRRVGLHRTRTAAAAVVVLLLGATAAVALPGSPLRDWLPGTGDGEVVESMPTSGTMADGLQGAAVALELREGSARIEVEGREVTAPLLVRWTDEEAVRVQTPPGAGLETGAGWLRVRGGGEGALRLEVPRSARGVEIQEEGRAPVRLDSGRIEVDGAPMVAEGDAAGWIQVVQPGAEAPGAGGVR
jgi:anti-sigma factor RsiW